MDKLLEQQNTRTSNWARHVLHTLAVVLALTASSSTAAGGHPDPREAHTSQIQLVGINAAGTNSGSGGSYPDTLSADGRLVAFSSDANDLVTNDPTRPIADPITGQRDVFVRDLKKGITTLVSVNRFWHREWQCRFRVFGAQRRWALHSLRKLRE